MQLTTVERAANQLSVKKQTLRLWTWQGLIPFVRLGRAVRYEQSVIDRIAAEGLKTKKKN